MHLTIADIGLHRVTEVDNKATKFSFD